MEDANTSDEIGNGDRLSHFIARNPDGLFRCRCDIDDAIADYVEGPSEDLAASAAAVAIDQTGRRSWTGTI
jgi:hypothetical protein